MTGADRGGVAAIEAGFRKIGIGRTAYEIALEVDDGDRVQPSSCLRARPAPTKRSAHDGGGTLCWKPDRSRSSGP